MRAMRIPEIAKGGALLILGVALILAGGGLDAARWVGWAALPVATLCGYVAIQAGWLALKLKLAWPQLSASQQAQAHLSELKSNIIHLIGACTLCLLVWHLT